MVILTEFIRLWAEEVLDLTWLIPLLIPVVECLDNMWRAFIGGGNDKKK